MPSTGWRVRPRPAGRSVPGTCMPGRWPRSTGGRRLSGTRALPGRSSQPSLRPRAKAVGESGEKVAACLDHRGVEAETADIDVGQYQAGALGTVAGAFVAYPRCGGLKLGPRGALVLRLRPSVGGEIVTGEADVAQKTRPDGDPRLRRRQAPDHRRHNVRSLNQEPLGFFAAHLDGLLDVRVHQLAHRRGDTSPLSNSSSSRSTRRSTVRNTSVGNHAIPSPRSSRCASEDLPTRPGPPTRYTR